MTMLEAVEALSARAGALSTKLSALGALAVVGAGVAVAGAAVLLQWAFIGVAFLKLAALAGGVGAIGAAYVARRLIKQAIALRRATWLEDLARTEGLNAKELAQYFTLDSW